MPIYGGTRIVDLSTDIDTSKMESYLASIEASNASITITMGSVAFETASIVQYGQENPAIRAYTASTVQYQGNIKEDQTIIRGEVVSIDAHQATIDINLGSVVEYGANHQDELLSIDAHQAIIEVAGASMAYLSASIVEYGGTGLDELLSIDAHQAAIEVAGASVAFLENEYLPSLTSIDSHQAVIETFKFASVIRYLHKIAYPEEPF